MTYITSIILSAILKKRLSTSRKKLVSENRDEKKLAIFLLELNQMDLFPLLLQRPLM